MPLGAIAQHYVDDGGGFTGYAAEVMADSPAMYLRLGDASGTTAVDTSGNGRNGTYNGSPTLGVTGLLVGDSDTCVTFDATDDYVSLAHAAWMDASPFTVEAVISPDVVSGARTIMSRYSTTTPSHNRWTFRQEVNRVKFYIFHSTASFVGVSTTTNMTAGGVYHVAATYDGSTMRIYFNGSQQATATQNTIRSSTVGLNVGHAGSFVSNREAFDGELDEVAFYSSALSSTRIAAHFAATGL